MALLGRPLTGARYRGNAKALVLARAGKALIVATDFASGGLYRLDIEAHRLDTT